MTQPSEAPRRFYKTTGALPVDGGFAVQLDGRTVRTPGGLPLVAPGERLAQMLAGEWDSQGQLIVMASMPATRLAFTALDRVAQARAEVIAEVGRYAGSDVLCYFAEWPKPLVERQVQAWGPMLDWAADDLGLHLERATGIAHKQQPAESLLRAARHADALDDFGLAGLAHATAVLGSAVLAFALQREKIGGTLAYELSRLDELYQIEQWGEDEEAQLRARGIHAEALMLEAWFRALNA